MHLLKRLFADSAEQFLLSTALSLRKKENQNTVLAIYFNELSSDLYLQNFVNAKNGVAKYQYNLVDYINSSSQPEFFGRFMLYSFKWEAFSPSQGIQAS